jgi:hypothetical protein
MFIFSLVTFAWTLAILGSVLVSYIDSWWRYSFVLQSAHIVVLNNVPSQGGLTKVDVTREMRMLPQRTVGRKLSILPRILSLAKTTDLQDALASQATTPTASDPRIRKSPLCYLDIQYTRSPLRKKEDLVSTVYRYLYPIYAMSDRMCYPPKCTLSARAAAPKAGAMSSAMLTLRYDGASTRQLSCNVTDRVKGLEGPCGDFHRHSQSGYQLRRHIMRVVLMSDIMALKDTLEDDMPTPPPSSSSSSDSLRSLAPMNPPLSIRLQFQKPHHRMEVMTLEPRVMVS